MNQYSVSYGFGTYDLPFNGGNHFGVDWEMFVGTELKSITDWTVVSAVWDDQGGGNTITLRETENYYKF